MAKYEVQGPDGSRYEVTMPEGLSPEQMRSALEKHFSDLGIKTQRVENKPAPTQQTPAAPQYDFSGTTAQVRQRAAALPSDQRKAFVDEWAKSYVGKERQNGGVGQYVNDVVRNVARGTGVGSWLDEANAMTSAGLNKLGIGGAPYDEALAYQRATDAAIDRESTKIGELPLIGDVTVGGAQKLVGGLASAPFMPVARVMGGTTMLPRIVNTGVSGAGYGALYGAGEGTNGQERVLNSLIGFGIGGGIGAAAPPVAAGVSRLFSRAPRPDGALAPLNRRAVDNVADDIVADRVSGMQPGTMMPEAMIADMGPNLQGHVGGIARIPGQGQTIVKDALGGTITQGRRGGAADRIRATTDDALGPAQDIVALESRMVTDANARARPYYREFEETVIPRTPEIDRLMTRVQGAPGVVQQAERLMQLEGFTPPGPDWAVRTGKDWDLFKRAVDELAYGARPGSNERRLYRALANDITSTLDRMLERMNNGVSSYGRARQIAGSGQQFREGVEQGQNAFKNSTHPDQMRADLAGMGARPMQREAYNIGARGAIRDIMGKASSSLGSTGDAAVRRQLGSDYARDKLAQVVGPQRAGQIIQRLEAETLYEQTRQTAVGNSVTTAMQNQARRYGARPEMADNIPASLWTDAKSAARWVLNRMSAGYLDERKRAEARDAARILVAQGEHRDAFIEALVSYVNRRETSQRARLAAEDVLAAALDGLRQPVVSARAISEERRP